jgi:two-component system LytT family response regulator
MKKAEQKISNEKLNSQLKQFLENINNSINTKVALPVEGKLIFINPNEIMYCKAVGPRSVVHTCSNDVYTSSKPIGECEDILPDKFFFRIHNSYLVNLNFITKYIKGRGGFIEMQDGTRIEVAARRRDDFLSRFNT